MEKKHKLIIGALIVIIAILACLITAYTLMPQEKPDNVIKIDGITFNTTNATNFTHLKNQDEYEDAYTLKCYGIKDNESMSGYGINIMQFHDNAKGLKKMHFIKDQFDTKFIIDEKEVYLASAGSGNSVGEARYLTFIYNSDLKELVIICTPDANETVKIASSLKFTDK